MDRLPTLLVLGECLDRRPYDVVSLAELLLRVRTRDGRTVPLVANPAQRAFEARRTRRNIVLKARQMGITTWIAARFFLCTITRRSTLSLIVAHTREAAESIFSIVERMYANLPEDLRNGPLRRSRASVSQMVFPDFDSEIRIASAAEPNAGRGLSVQNLHCSEVARWPGDAAATLAGLRAALAPDGELVLESTPLGAQGAFYDEWIAATEAAVGRGTMLRHFFPWWMEPAYVGPPVTANAMTEAERELVTHHRLTPEQIGFRRSLEQNYGVLRSQEFAEDAETCFRVSGACCFDADAIERRMAELTAPAQTRRGGALHIFLPPAAQREYLLAVDTAGGGSEGDFSAIQVVDTATGMQCAELQERLRPGELARAAAALAREYNGASICVERNNHGAAVLAYLETRECYSRIWRTRNGGEAGWLTTSASKPEIIARLGTLLEQTPERFLSRRLLAECRTYIANDRGQTNAAPGSHDDLVMAMAIAQAARAA